MSEINIEDFNRLMEVEDFHFGHVTIMRSVKASDLCVLWKREETLSAEKLALYSNQLSQRRTISHANLLSLLDFKVDQAANNIDVYFEYSPFKSSMLSFGSVDVGFKWLLDVLSALSYLNGLGFVHGDVRPEFVVYFPSQRRFKIVDKFANFTHPSTALKSYIKSGKEIFASPRFFNEICNKKVKEAKFNFYKNESFSLGMVLLKMLYGETVKLKEIYSHKFKIFNTFYFLELLKGLESKAGSHKEQVLLDFMKTKLLCFNESERLSPGKALDALTEVIRQVYGKSHLDDFDPTQIILKSEQKGLLRYFPGLRTSSPEVGQVPVCGELEILEIAEDTDQFSSDSSSVRGKKSLDNKKNTIAIDLEHQQYIQVHAISTSKPSLPSVEEKSSKVTPKEDKLIDFRQNPFHTYRKTESSIPGIENYEKIRAKSREITDVKYRNLDQFFSSTRRLLPAQDVQIIHNLGIKGVKPSQGYNVVNISDQSQTILVKQDEWKSFIDPKAVDHRPNVHYQEAEGIAKTDRSFIPRAKDEQEAVMNSAIKSDYEVFITFKVVVPEEKILVSQEVVPSMSTANSEHFSIKIEDNFLKVNFAGSAEMEEVSFSLDEISKKGLSINLAKTNNRLQMKHRFMGQPPNIPSIEKLQTFDQEVPAPSPRVLRKFITSNETCATFTGDIAYQSRGQGFLSSRNETSRPTLVSIEPKRTTPLPISTPRISTAYYIAPQYTTHSYNKINLSSRHNLHIIDPSINNRQSNLNNKSTEKSTFIPSSCFVNAIPPYSDTSRRERIHTIPTLPSLRSHARDLQSNHQTTSTYTAQPAPLPPSADRLWSSEDLRPNFSAVFTKRVL
jgi:hypothetical protein